MNPSRNTEQGRFLRSFVSEPVSSLVRPEDLAFCASRLLRLSQFARRTERGLAELMELALQDLSRLDPESALDRVHEAQRMWPERAETWGLACHVLAHTLSEFSREASAGVIEELRTSLEDWYTRFRSGIEGRPAPADATQLTLLQCYVTQAAIFHDTGAMEWGCEQLLEALSPELLASDAGLETGEFLSGLFSRPGDEQARQQLGAVAARAGETSPKARLLAERLGAGSKLGRPGDPPPAATHGMPSDDRNWKKQVAAGRKGKKEKEKSKVRVWIEEAIESYAWIIGPLAILAVGGICVLGFGRFYDWFEATSPVGDQSLQDWYRTAAAQREAREASEREGGVAPATDIGIDIAEIEGRLAELDQAPPAEPGEANAATPTPSPPVAESSSPEETLRELLALHTRWMRPALAVPREEVASLREPGQRVEAWGEYVSTTHELIEENGELQARVFHTIRWLENGSGAGQQYIEVRYAHRDAEWELVGAARRLTPPDENDAPSYVTDPDDLSWARELFEENPFY